MTATLTLSEASTKCVLLIKLNENITKHQKRRRETNFKHCWLTDGAIGQTQKALSINAA